MQEISNLNEAFIIERLTNELNDEIMKVWDTLMGLELQLVDQLEETIKDFERNLADMYAGFLEQIRAQYPFIFHPINLTPTSSTSLDTTDTWAQLGSYSFPFLPKTH